MNNYKLYVHIAPSGKRYYGITSTTTKQRWSNGRGYKNNKYFWRAINKYGWDNIQHEVLFDNLTESEAKELERYMIQWYDTANKKYGYNLSRGGESNSGCERTEEWNQKISEANKGKNHPMYGKHHTEGTKQKMSESKKGKGKGINNSQAKSVICLTTKRIFFTTKEGAEYYSTFDTRICKCCKGKAKSAGKYNGQKLVWKYVNYKHNKTYRVVEPFDIDSWNLFDGLDDEPIDYDNVI